MGVSGAESCCPGSGVRLQQEGWGYARRSIRLVSRESVKMAAAHTGSCKVEGKRQECACRGLHPRRESQQASAADSCLKVST